MERNCFAFREGKHNHCKCTILKEMICKNRECSLYKHENEVDMTEIEYDIKEYSEKKQIL